MKKNKLKSSSLSYGLFIIIIIGVVLFSLIILKNSWNKILIDLELEGDLIESARNTENYLLVNYNDLENKKKNINIGIRKIAASKKKWGVLNVLQYKVFSGKDSIRQALFIENNLKDTSVLFLKKNDKKLLLAGRSIIKGDVRVPFGEFDVLNLSGYNNKLIFEGSMNEAVIDLPKIRDFYIENDIVDITEENIYNERSNSFFNQTKRIKITSSFIENLNLSGNYIIESSKEIIISKLNNLNDIIIKAPIVKIEKGFKGVVQIFSTNKVEVEDKVMLEYPSVIYVKGKSIRIGKQSKILGAVILNENDESNINVSVNSVVVGDLFCSGNVDFKGEMHGAMYINKFYLKTEESIYQNALLDFKLKHSPNFFKRIDISDNGTSVWEVIKRTK